MITNAFLQLAYNIISGVIKFLPQSSGFPVSWHVAFQGIGNLYHMTDSIIPASIFFSCFLALIVAQFGVFGWKSVKSIISHLPFFGGNG